MTAWHELDVHLVWHLDGQGLGDLDIHKGLLHTQWTLAGIMVQYLCSMERASVPVLTYGVVGPAIKTGERSWGGDWLALAWVCWLAHGWLSSL